ncbi:uncharacterized protein LOC126834666 [Adelges cooleyi]|uniref:uncharacterized protein LOC126834666 n=1 Tax=Adelges cooleyi TaxID=133065 RepID=UPI00217F8115|nr:uncharacterized protein LOC126834666 [Adelges cooleyi]
MLSYLDVHLVYTLPAIGVLTLITWPFINRSEIFKITFLSLLALVYTTPWDNYLIANGAWIYQKNKVLGVLGYVPIEEYMFFILQTTLTSLWALMCMRWSTPCLNFNYNKPSFQLIRWIPILLLSITTLIGWTIAIPGEKSFYLGTILWWVCPVTAFVWYGAGNYFTKKKVSASVAIIVPTVYLCWIDQLALKQNVWHINEQTSLEIFPFEDLPIEEAFFFFIVNVMIVLGVCAYDKARGLSETYTSDYPYQFGMNKHYIGQMLFAFLTDECSKPEIVVKDIKKSMDVLAIASKSFNVASFLFQSGIRLDLMILYAFCRVTDDMIDDEPDVDKKKRKLELTTQFVDELFADRKSDYDVKTKPHMPQISWPLFESELSDDELACFRAISRITFYLPRKPFYDLLAGYKWDIDGRFVKDETDLLLYSSYVAGSVGMLCVYVMMYRSDDRGCEFKEKHEYVIGKAHQMGQVLQIVNIARDIITDSETLGRCYVPTDYMDDEIEEIKILCHKKNPRTLGNQKLKKYSTRMIQLANKFQTESVVGIRCLPKETRGAVLAATDIYQGLTSKIQSNAIYPKRAALSKWSKIFIGLYSLYFKSIQYIL